VTATTDIAGCLWPVERRDELKARVAGAAGIGAAGAAERFEWSYADVAPALSARARASAPAVVRVGAGAGALLGVVEHGPGGARVIGPGGDTVVCDAAALAAYLRAPAEAEARAGIDATVARAGIEAGRAPAVAAALLRAALGAERVAEGERLRPASASMGAALREAGVGRRLALAVAGYLAQLALVSGLWWTVGGRAVAADAAGGGSIAIIVGIIAALAAVRLLSSWTAGRLAIDGGRVLRERLLRGLLSLDTESTRAEGIGQLLGRIVETEALESLALGGGLAAAAGAFELVTGVVVLALGAAAGWQLPLLVAWCACAAVLAARVQRALARWSAERVALTHDLVERMAGHRTLVAQQAAPLRHVEQEAALARYAAAGRRLDRAVAVLGIAVPRGWLIAAVVLLAPSLAVAVARPGAFATSLGGTLLVYGALRKLAQAFPALGAAVIAWRQVASMFAGAARAENAERPSPPGPAPSPAPPADGAVAPVAAPLLSARDLGFRYPGRAEAVLSGCALDIRRGDRLLLEGPSGGGKSTLGALLVGLRAPDAGTLTLAGIDQREIGLARWRGRVGAAPQFHENHVFSASFLFNLLLGRAWPPRREDVAEAEAVARELDLGPLLARMPSGLEQLVGDSGWQLSHGERSRLFIARALLQPLDVRVLDESFAALDPETLERALACVLRRAETLVVIAHP
jgi:ATP-binding cassette subfamily B protein